MAVASLFSVLACTRAPGSAEARQANRGEAPPPEAVAPDEGNAAVPAEPTRCAGDEGKAGFLRSCIAAESLTRSYVGRTSPGPTPSERYCRCVSDRLSDADWQRLRQRMAPDCTLPADAITELDARELVQAACGHLRI